MLASDWLLPLNCHFSTTSLAMEESTLRWPTDKEREEMEEVCSIGEVRCERDDAGAGLSAAGAQKWPLPLC